MIQESHPYFFLEPLFSRQDAVFQFSRYVYTPDSVFDERDTFDVSGPDVTVGWLDEQIDSLSARQELAIHSKVVIAGRSMHIPMLDFSTSTIQGTHLRRLRALLPERVFRNAAFFSSGRSFHLYSVHLSTPKEWMELLGRALLVNLPGVTPIVDTRWVGHRLLAGYCSLRVSNNSRLYEAMPARLSLAAVERGAANQNVTNYSTDDIRM
jgi:hypothetical protein